jgi:hypothetical protein
MSLSPEVVRGLEAELLRLEDERKSVEATIASIRQLLGQSLPVERGPGMVVSAAPAGFRDGIRAVLKQAGKPLSPKEVATAIRGRKYPGWDSETLNARVNNDLWKMKEIGQLEKADDGYTLADGGGTG